MTAESSYSIPAWTIGDRLRKARETTGLTTGAFAEQVGVTQKTISDAENDKRGVPRRILLNAYAMRTRVPVEWLLYGENPSDTPPDSRTCVQGSMPSQLHLVAA